MLYKDIKVGRSKLKGKGFFAKAKIKRGEVVWKLNKGEKIYTREEFNKLPYEQREIGFQYKDGFVVVKDDSRFMNHSCDPNTWWTNDYQLSAIRDIEPGEELTYDYSTAEANDWISDWECKCGSSNCRKYISGKECLNPEFQKKYKGHLPSWVEDFIRSKQNHNLGI